MMMMMLVVFITQLLLLLELLKLLWPLLRALGDWSQLPVTFLLCNNEVNNTS
jgi:hypothetical protein